MVSTGKVRQTDFGQVLNCKAPAGAVWHASHAQAELDVLQRIQPRKTSIGLRYRGRVLMRTDYGLTVNQHLAAFRKRQAGNECKDCALATAGRTQQADEFATSIRYRRATI